MEKGIEIALSFSLLPTQNACCEIERERARKRGWIYNIIFQIAHITEKKGMIDLNDDSNNRVNFPSAGCWPRGHLGKFGKFMGTWENKQKHTEIFGEFLLIFEYMSMLMHWKSNLVFQDISKLDWCVLTFYCCTLGLKRIPC